jgi:hypothetical protein
MQNFVSRATNIEETVKAFLDAIFTQSGLCNLPDIVQEMFRDLYKYSLMLQETLPINEQQISNIVAGLLFDNILSPAILQPGILLCKLRLLSSYI